MGSRTAKAKAAATKAKDLTVKAKDAAARGAKDIAGRTPGEKAELAVIAATAPLIVTGGIGIVGTLAACHVLAPGIRRAINKRVPGAEAEYKRARREARRAAWKGS